MRRFDLILATLVLIDLIVLVAWFKIPPTSPMITAVGLPAPRADTDRYCSAWYSQDAWIRFPSRTVTCQGHADPEHPEERQEVSYDQLMRRVEHVHAMLTAPDSVTWSARLDSIARTVSARGGREILCPPAHRVLTHIKAERHWRFTGFDVRLIAYRFVDHDPRLSEWLLQIDAFTRRSAGLRYSCGPA